MNLRGAATATPFVTNIDYNAKGQRELIEYGNGASTGYEYDLDTFRLVHLTTTRTSDNAKLQDLRYTYDPVGNITQISDEAQQTIYFNNQVVTASAAYAYDAIYRLIQATGREHIGQAAQPQTTFDDAPRIHLLLPTDGQAMRNYTETYQYDPVGNILALIHSANNSNWTRTYAYDEPNPNPTNNRLTSTTVGSAKEPYTYDAHGNMTTMPHLPTMEWDFNDQLHVTQRQVVNNTPGEKTFYVYDSGGQRVRKVTERPNGTRKNERFYFGGFEVYREYDSAGNTVTLERETLHVVDNKRRIALVETRTQGSEPNVPQQIMRYQYDNHLGSACLELDENAAVISYEEYYPYGSTSYQAGRSAVEVNLKRYRYTGKERDEESELYYHGARYYVQWLGRWPSCDPQGITDGVNLFMFSRANPVGFVDRTGRNSDKAQQARELYERTGQDVNRLHRELFSAQDKLVEAESKLAQREYKLSELRSEEIKRGLENEPKHERAMRQAEHNLEQARRNLSAAKSRFETVQSELSSAYEAFGKAQKAAAKAGVDISDVAIRVEKEFEALTDTEEMKRPDWKAAAKKGSGPKGGGPGGGGSPPAGQPPQGGSPGQGNRGTPPSGLGNSSLRPSTPARPAVPTMGPIGALLFANAIVTAITGKDPLGNFSDLVLGGLRLDPEARVRFGEGLQITPADRRAAEAASRERELQDLYRRLAEKEGISVDEVRRRFEQAARSGDRYPTIGPVH